MSSRDAQGRYKAYLIEDAKAYVAKVTQYIHLNPVRIRSLEDAPLDMRHLAALDCRWSSYGQIMGVRACPKWLHRNAVLNGWGKDLATKRKAYRHAVEPRDLSILNSMYRSARNT